MAKDFKGHFEPADPRNVLWGAGGADWPTVPPYRIRLGGEHARREWRILVSSGVLFEATPLSTHDDVTWEAIPPLPDEVDGMWIWRHYDKPAQKVWWFLIINHQRHFEPLQLTQIVDPGPANVTVYIDNEDWPYAHIRDPMTPFSLWQVYFNETMPPEGWPPW